MPDTKHELTPPEEALAANDQFAARVRSLETHILEAARKHDLAMKAAVESMRALTEAELAPPPRLTALTFLQQNIREAVQLFFDPLASGAVRLWANTRPMRPAVDADTGLVYETLKGLEWLNQYASKDFFITEIPPIATPKSASPPSKPVRPRG